MRISTESTPRNPFITIIQENIVTTRANSIISRNPYKHIKEIQNSTNHSTQ